MSATFKPHGIQGPITGDYMARIHADPVTTALMHPTRRALYEVLLDTDEYTTVQLQKLVKVDRYNLYHHLHKLESLNLVMNHRDEGRTRWWCVMDRVPLPNDGRTISENSIGQIDLSNPKVQAAVRTMLRDIEEMTGQDLNLDAATLESLQINGRRNP